MLSADIDFMFWSGSGCIRALVTVEADPDDFDADETAWKVSSIRIAGAYAKAVTNPDLWDEIERDFREECSSTAQECLCADLMRQRQPHEHLTAADYGVGHHRIGGLGA